MKNQTAFVTGADRGLGLALCENLLAHGWQVFAGQYLPDWNELDALVDNYPGKLHLIPLDVASLESAQNAAKLTAEITHHIDLLINNAGVNTPTKERKIDEGQDYAEFDRMYQINSVGPLRVVESFGGLLEQGNLKRLAFVSSEAGSIERCTREAWYGYTMSKAALNRAVKVMFNHLHPQGFTFRLFHPGWVQSYIGGEYNSEAHLTPVKSAATAVDHFINPLADEDQLAMYDFAGKKWPW
jgi:NAD(P)-dependent dehydrogenase (short-subunit alcohol dehydrogenase family)